MKLTPLLRNLFPLMCTIAGGANMLRGKAWLGFAWFALGVISSYLERYISLAESTLGDDDEDESESEGTDGD